MLLIAIVPRVQLLLSFRCESDWRVAYLSFTIGIPLFLVMLGLVAWVVFWRHPNRELGSSFVTAIAFFTLLFWVLHTKYKWDDLLSKVGSTLSLIQYNSIEGAFEIEARRRPFFGKQWKTERIFSTRNIRFKMGYGIVLLVDVNSVYCDDIR